MKYIPTRRVATHPGAFIREEIEERGLSVPGLARDLGLPATRLHEIARERRGVSAETAIALGEYFGQSPMFWIDAQKIHELSSPKNYSTAAKKSARACGAAPRFRRSPECRRARPISDNDAAWALTQQENHNA